MAKDTNSLDKSSIGSSSDNSFEKRTSSANSGSIATVKKLLSVDRSHHQLYITGLRGILVIQSFIWTFFLTFIPTLVSNNTDGPLYQDLLRIILGVPLWNGSFIYNFFIILSMRTIAVSFLTTPTGQTYAATIIRRNVRLVILIGFGSGMATLIYSQIGVQFIDDFINELPNDSIQTPVVVSHGGAAFNSLFNIFWLTYDHYRQAANTFWPTMTLWAPSIIYFQSYTVYFLMVIMPFTRPRAHLSGLFMFGLFSFWMGYWGWYSVTGLAFADLSINTTLRQELRLGLKITEDWRLPYMAIAPLFFAVGIALKYVFAVFPQHVNAMLVIHPYLELSTRYSQETVVESGPYARLDDWFVIVGILLAVELSEKSQHLLTFRPLVILGERSYCVFVAQCIFFWTGGIQLWRVLYNDRGLSTASANGVVFLVGLLAVAVFSELYWRLIDLPSVWLAKRTYSFLVD